MLLVVKDGVAGGDAAIYVYLYERGNDGEEFERPLANERVVVTYNTVPYLEINTVYLDTGPDGSARIENLYLDLVDEYDHRVSVSALEPKRGLYRYDIAFTHAGFNFEPDETEIYGVTTSAWDGSVTVTPLGGGDAIVVPVVNGAFHTPRLPDNGGREAGDGRWRLVFDAGGGPTTTAVRNKDAAEYFVIIDDAGALGPLSGAVGIPPVRPKPLKTAIGPNRPNPCRGTTVIPISVTTPSPVEITVFDLAGRKVKAVSYGSITAGENALTLDLTGFAPGVYVYEVKASREAATGKLVVAP
jgi:hypothetical protein